jgi:hypothetical protein
VAALIRKIQNKPDQLPKIKKEIWQRGEKNFEEEDF